MAVTQQYPYKPATDPGQPWGGYDQRNWINYNQEQNDAFKQWQAQTGQGSTLSSLLTSAGYRPFQSLLGMGGRLGQMGYGNLAQILAGQGETDPRRMQGMQRGIARDTAQNEQNVASTLAQRGLGNSGVGLALRGAVQQAGSEGQANLRANEAQLAEQRKRDDLNLFMQMVMGPATDASAMALGQYNTDRANKQAGQQQQQDRYAQLIMAALMCHATAELFGDGSSHVDAVRAFMVMEAAPMLLAAYSRNSKALAFEIAHSPTLRVAIEPAFAKMAERGYVLIGG